MEKWLDELENGDFNNSSQRFKRKLGKFSEKRHMDSMPMKSYTVHGSSSGTISSSSSQYNKFDSVNQIEESTPGDDSDVFLEEQTDDSGDVGSESGFSEVELEEQDVVQLSIAELTKPGQKLVIARGGEGGLGSASLGKVSNGHNYVKPSATTSDFEMSYGEDNAPLTAGSPGSESVLVLELKSIADVGLVGMPNTGKSTLLGAISRAKPVVGDYAFTTLRPNIGHLNYDDFFSITVADIPGLIKGAHENRGLGHAFLRHIECTKVLAYVVDLAATLDGRKGTPPWEQLRDLVLELEYHRAGLSEKPSVVVANKIDEEGTDTVYEELKRRVTNVPIYPVCAILEEGVVELKVGLRRLVDGTESWRLDLFGIDAD